MIYCFATKSSSEMHHCQALKHRNEIYALAFNGTFFVSRTDFDIFNSVCSPENGLSRYFEMRNLKCSLLPGLPILPFSTLFFKWPNPEGGGQGSGPPSLVNHKFDQIL